MSAKGGDDLRIETKFIGAEPELPDVLGWIHMHPALFRSPYPDRWVHNLYFDTWDCQTFAANVSGESQRTKLRYRWYGESPGPDRGAFELKRRHNGVGWKLRHAVERAPWNAGGSWRAVRSALAAQLPAQAREWLRAFPLPTLLNCYRRRYFVSRDGSVRLTVDWKLRAWDQRYQAAPSFTRRANLPPCVVLEGKCGVEHRAALVRVLHGVPMRVSRNSKYVSGLRVASEA